MNTSMSLFDSGNAIRITSKEIADLVEKRHDNVRRTIETLAKQAIIQLPQIEEVEEINNLGFGEKGEV